MRITFWHVDFYCSFKKRKKQNNIVSNKLILTCGIHILLHFIKWLVDLRWLYHYFSMEVIIDILLSLCHIVINRFLFGLQKKVKKLSPLVVESTCQILKSLSAFPFFPHRFSQALMVMVCFFHPCLSNFPSRSDDLIFNQPLNILTLIKTNFITELYD